MLEPRAVVLASLLTACGAASPTPPPSPAEDLACERARAAAEATWAEVAERAHEAGQPPIGEAPLAEQALARLEAHLEALRATPHEVSGDEAMSISSAVMDGVDEVAAELRDGLRERADDAAEALLTDRGAEGSVRATRGAIIVLEEVLDATRPESADARRVRRAAMELERRATRTSEAYARDVADGDHFADRAEAAPLPASAEALIEARGEAARASARARERCRVPRTLAAPSIE